MYLIFCLLDIVYCIMELEASEPLHKFICMDEAGFNLTNRRRRGRNVISHKAAVDVPGQWGGNITIGAAVSENSVLMHIPIIRPHHIQRLCHPSRQSLQGSHPWTREGSDWRWLAKVSVSTTPASSGNGLRPTTPCSHSLTPLRIFFSTWRCKVYDHQSHTQMTLLAAMDAACNDITADTCRGWIRHYCIKDSFHAKEDIRCDVAQPRGTSERVGRLHHSSYSAAWTVFSLLFQNFSHSLVQNIPPE